MFYIALLAPHLPFLLPPILFFLFLSHPGAVFHITMYIRHRSSGWIHLIPLCKHTHTYIYYYTHAQRACSDQSCLKTDPFSHWNTCRKHRMIQCRNKHTLAHTKIIVVSWNTHTNTDKWTQKQRAHPEPSNVDSDPAIFKGHTSQDIISSSFVLRDLVYLHNTKTHRHTHKWC